MSLLILAALVWLLIHIGLSGTPLRGVLVARVGEQPFRGIFSMLTLLALAFLIWARSGAPTTPLWFAPGWLRWILVAVMLAAFLLFVGSVIRTNPTAVGGERAMTQPLRGLQRITRHPMLWSFALWSVVHIIGNGDTAAIVFFGTFLVTVLVGMPSIDAKLARRDPMHWRALSASTSLVPFAAIATGRNRFVLREIGWLVPVVALVAWAAVLHLHPWLFGVPPVAM